MDVISYTEKDGMVRARMETTKEMEDKILTDLNFGGKLGMICNFDGEIKYLYSPKYIMIKLQGWKMVDAKFIMVDESDVGNFLKVTKITPTEEWNIKEMCGPPIGCEELDEVEEKKENEVIEI